MLEEKKLRNSVEDNKKDKKVKVEEVVVEEVYVKPSMFSNKDRIESVAKKENERLSQEKKMNK